MKTFVERYLKIYSHEFSRFVWIAAAFLAIFFVTAIFRNYVDAAFLKRYGPEYIPWMLVISALVTMIVLKYADNLAKRFSDSYLLAGFLAVYAVGAALCFLMVKAGFTIVYPILYQLMGLLDAVLLVYLWNIAGDLFDARQGKRIFPLITASQVLGTTLGSFATKPITFVTGENATLLIFGTVFLMTAAYLFLTSKTWPVSARQVALSVAPSEATKSLSEVPGLMKEYPIVRYLIICGLIPNILLPIFSYQFSVIANDTFASEQTLITFLSMFRGCTTLVTFVILFFVGRLYTRMGLPNASLVHPLNFTVLFTSLAGIFNIFVAAYGQFSVILIQRAIAGPVNKILFSVIPKELQAWGRSFIRGTVLKIGMLVGSVLMIVLKPVLDARDFAYIGVVLAIFWVYETLTFRKEYKRILKQVIIEGKIDFDQAEAVSTFDAGGAPMGLESQAVDTSLHTKPSVPVPTAQLEPDTALKLLTDANPDVRAEAARAFAVNPDIRATRKLIRCLDDVDERVRDSAIEALITFPQEILPFLEASLIRCGTRGKQAILEVIRLSPNLDTFEMSHLLGKAVEEAYGNLMVIRQLQSHDTFISVKMLQDHLLTRNDEILRLLFYALWVYHADMKLMYQALKSENASVAVEMVETSIRGDNVPYLLPLIDDVPLDEKIEHGRKLFALVQNDTLERLLTLLAQSEDPITRLLSVYVMAELLPNSAFIPAIESGLEDEDPFVRQVSQFAMDQSMNKETRMPEILETIDMLKKFRLFQGLGTRELHAVASVASRDRFKAGETLIGVGDDNHSIYLVLSGKIKIFHAYGTPEQQEVRSVEQWGYLNFGPMFAKEPPLNTSVVIEDTEAFVIPQNQFHEIIRVYPQIALNMLEIAATVFRQLGYSA